MVHLDYVYLRAWCRMMGSHSYYVDGEVEAARKDKAPQNAIYRDTKGNWMTFDGVTRVTTREVIEKYVKEASQD